MRAAAVAAHDGLAQGVVLDHGVGGSAEAVGLAGELGALRLEPVAPLLEPLVRRRLHGVVVADLVVVLDGDGVPFLAELVGCRLDGDDAGRAVAAVGVAVLLQGAEPLEAVALEDVAGAVALLGVAFDERALGGGVADRDGGHGWRLSSCAGGVSGGVRTCPRRGGGHVRAPAGQAVWDFSCASSSATQSPRLPAQTGAPQQ